MSIKIENKVPIPPPNQGVRKFPWDTLKVGQSFVVTSKSNVTQLCRMAQATRKSKKFEGRMLNGVKRVWRVK